MSNYKHIEFIDGGNPYISKTREDFNKLSKKYYLFKLSDNNFIALCEKDATIKTNLMIDWSGYGYNPEYIFELPRKDIKRLENILIKKGYNQKRIDDIINSKLKDIK